MQTTVVPSPSPLPFPFGSCGSAGNSSSNLANCLMRLKARSVFSSLPVMIRELYSSMTTAKSLRSSGLMNESLASCRNSIGRYLRP